MPTGRYFQRFQVVLYFLYSVARYLFLTQLSFFGPTKSDIRNVFSGEYRENSQLRTPNLNIYGFYRKSNIISLSLVTRQRTDNRTDDPAGEPRLVVNGLIIVLLVTTILSCPFLFLY
jgi:hypothetical protein